MECHQRVINHESADLSLPISPLTGAAEPIVAVLKPVGGVPARGEME